jgi:acetylornithine/succinyldiaminopimelate/putrescine aminotransferase
MRHPLVETFEQMIRERIPNFFRLYLNPHVAQTCFCLSRLVRDIWYADIEDPPVYQVFLANGFDEALSGAVKLVRFVVNEQRRPHTGLLCAPPERLAHFAALELGDRGRLELIPDLLIGDETELAALIGSDRQYGYVVTFPPRDRQPSGVTWRGQRPLIIACVGREELRACRALSSLGWNGLTPDIVVFDESFVHRHVPFGAFAARKPLYDYWNRPSHATFHSTTFQPNSVSALHFLKCLQQDEPTLCANVSWALERLRDEPAECKRIFARLYSPGLTKTIVALDCAVSDVMAEGHYVTVGGRRIFDGVAGIACSVRGHNPATYVQELESLDAASDVRQAVRQRLKDLTGSERMVPAVSGAAAVENALRIGLAAQFPRTHVLALQGGFGGKTLFALTGTARASYKERLGPLYPRVTYIDPFGEKAVEELEAVLDSHPVGLVQIELIQAVGGVRAVPERVVRYLAEERRKRGYLLFVDEVQTGMYRTGPFSRCEHHGLVPDLLTIGKGASDMMFPFAATLYSTLVQQKLDDARCRLASDLEEHADYEYGYRTLRNTLDWSRAGNLAARVKEVGTVFADRLALHLDSCKAVRDIRVFGLLIAIELDLDRSFRKWLGKRAPFIYILNMLLHRSFPLLIGYCQYEPHVLKITPPLTISDEEIQQVCATIADVLHMPMYGLAPRTVRHLARTYLRGKWKSVRRIATHESVAR